MDNYGWLLVEPSLQCVGLSNVFASGDCASFGNKYGLGFPPKAGVYAVRQGAVLAHNLDILLSSRAATQPLKPFVPQPCFLSLLSTGDGRGIGSKYGLVFTGTWVYRLKSYIDEMWQNRFRSSSNRTSSHVSRTGVVDSKFEGSPAEGAVVLLAAEDIFSNDSFEQQLMVLRRMDNDMHFRERLLACVEVS